MKKILTLILSVIMLVNLSAFTSFANENVVARQISFEEMITRYFEHKDTTVVLNKAGKDITSEFFSYNTVNFNKRDYQKIRNYIESNVSNLSYRVESSIENRVAVNSLGTSKYVSDYTSMPISDKYGHKGYLIMEVGGTIIYNPNTGEILRAYNAKLVRAEYSDLQDWTLTNRNVRTSSTISTDKFKAFFTASLRSIGTYSHFSQEYDFGIHQFTVSTEAGN
jgi:hypothetical protein